MVIKLADYWRKIVEFDGYHVTPTKNVKLILDSYNQRKPIEAGINLLTKQAARGQVKRPGSLGYGIYTFVKGLDNPESLVKAFAKRTMKNIEVKQVIFDIAISEDEYLNLTSTQSEDFRSFANFCTAAEKIINNHNLRFTQSGNNQHVWDGIATELFLAHLSETEGASCYGVLRDTFTPTGVSQPNVAQRMTSNGYEFLIRDWQIVRSLKHDVLKLQ